MDGLRRLVQIHHQLVLELRGVGIQGQGRLTVIQAELTGQIRAEIGGDLRPHRAAEAPDPLALARPCTELFHEWIGRAVTAASRDLPRSIFCHTPSCVQSRAHQRTKEVVLVVSNAADYTPTLIPGPRVLEKASGHLFRSRYVISQRHGIATKTHRLIEVIVQERHARRESVVGVSKDVCIQHVTPEEPLPTIVIVPAKTLHVSMIVETPLGAYASPLRIGENEPRFGSCFHPIQFGNG